MEGPANMTREPHDLDDFRPARPRAVRAARGLAPFDVLISGARLVDVATSEIRAPISGWSRPLVASVHAPGSRGDAGGWSTPPAASSRPG